MHAHWDKSSVSPPGGKGTPPPLSSPPLHVVPWGGGNRHFVNQQKIKCCSLMLLCIAPLRLLPTHWTYCGRTFSVA